MAKISYIYNTQKKYVLGLWALGSGICSAGMYRGCTAIRTGGNDKYSANVKKMGDNLALVARRILHVADKIAI